MSFKDDYEYIIDGNVYYIHVEGRDGKVNYIDITDEMGYTVDAENEHYKTLRAHARKKTYAHNYVYNYYDTISNYEGV